MNNEWFNGAAPVAGAYEIERSLRFNSADSAYLSRTPSSSGNRKKWTLSIWVKRSKLGASQAILHLYNYPTPAYYDTNFAFNASDQIVFNNYDTSAWNGQLTTAAVFRDCSAWYHIVCSCDTDAATPVKIYVNNVQQTLTGTQPSAGSNTGFNYTATHRLGINYDVGNGLTNGFNGYFADPHLIDGQALDPTSFTEVDATTGQLIPKAYSGTYGTNGFHLPFSNNSTAAALGTDTSGNGNTWTVNNISVESGSNYLPYLTSSNNSLTDGLNAFDGSISTAAYGAGGQLDFAPSPAISYTSSVEIYLDGTDNRNQYNFNNGGWVSPSPNSGWITVASGSGTLTSLSARDSISTGQISVTAYRIDGGILVDERVVGAGNDSLVDTPTSYGTDTGAGGEVRGNYCTGNPIHPNLDAAPVTLSNGNLDGSITSSSNWYTGQCTLAVTTGKWYFEQTINSGYAAVGIAAVTANFAAASDSVGSVANSVGYIFNGNKQLNGSTSSYGASIGSGDVIGCAFDMDAQTVTFYKNGASQGVIASAITTGVAYAPCFSLNGQNGTGSYSWNFGQRPFVYTAPSGFKALCDTNLAAPTIALPNEVMDVKLYTGNGSTQTISGLGFSPDFVWLKSRGAAYNHQLFDTIRGTGKQLYSNSTSAETTENFSWLNAFNSNGFEVTGAAGVNDTNDPMVAWTWDAGSSTVTNTQGSITSSVRANASAGFSIVTYTGNGSSPTTVGHGLNVAPSFLIAKNRDSATNWQCYHIGAQSSGALQLQLNTTTAATSNVNVWNNTAPTSSVFSIGAGLNGNTEGHVVYCFAPVAGYSAFGSFEGGSGVFVHTGFLPRWVLVKRSSATSDWIIYDTARDTYNVMGNSLYPSLSNAEISSPPRIDFVSNGFVTRASSPSEPSWTGTVIYASFAESPFQYARAR